VPDANNARATNARAGAAENDCNHFIDPRHGHRDKTAYPIHLIACHGMMRSTT